MALKSATSVPGCICRWMSARPASSVLRGSATISVAPRSCARLIAAPKTGCDSVVFAPAMKMTSAACSTSRIEPDRSEEHTSELQSRLHLVCRLLLEKKKKKNKHTKQHKKSIHRQ